jgi:hypothetical protein
MKRIFLLAAIMTSLAVHSQTNAYKSWLNTVSEIKFSDSTYLSIPSEITVTTGTDVIKSFLFPLHMESQHKQVYAVMGKITSSPDYDILLLYRYNFYRDSLWMKHLFLCTMSKTGTLLHYTRVAEILFDTQMGNRESSSWLFKDGSFITSMQGMMMKQPFKNRKRFTINHHGIVVIDTGFSPSPAHTHD